MKPFFNVGGYMRLSEKKLYLFDMDGTIYLDNEVFDGTHDLLLHIRESGGRYLFVTNNSSKSIEAYVEKLIRLGIPADKDSFLTSSEATALYIKNNFPDVLFYTLGTESFLSAMRGYGVRITTEVSDAVSGVLLSNDQELTFKKLDGACKIISTKDVVYIATNPDLVCPTSYGYVPDCGSFARIIETATGKSPYFIGKPRPEMLLLCMEKYGYTPDECLMIGDRVYTDIASGYNAGIDTVLVLSGEGTREDAENTDTKPTYIFDNVRELYNTIIQE